VSATTWLLVLAFTPAVWSAAAADDKPPRIPPEDARKFVGKCVEVVFEVKASKHSVQRKTVYLDSERSFQDEKNLGIAISERGVADLRQQRGIDAPAEYYRGKTIRVTGTVVLEDDRPYIKVDSADQLDLHAATP
jgi:hypothetical protein